MASGHKQRWTASNPCPICGGWDRMARGQGKRCAGFLSSDKKFAYCTREEHQGGAAGYSERAAAWFFPMKAPDEPPPRKKAGGKRKYDWRKHDWTYGGRVTRTYDYVDQHGELLMQVLRLEGPKEFRQRRPHPEFGWIGEDIGTVRQVPFRLPSVIESDPEEFVWFVEGEKDALRLAELGLVATTNPGGSSSAFKIKPEDLELAFSQRSVVIVLDNDDPSRKWARSLAEGIYPIAREVRILDLFPVGEWPEHADVSDWIDRQGRRPGPEIARELGELAFELKPFNPGTATEEMADQGPAWEPIELAPTGNAPEFPLDVLPIGLADLCSRVSKNMCCPLDFIAAPMLGLAGGVIGRSVIIRIKEGWKEPPLFYIGLIGEPGAMKTPPLNLVSRPLHAINRNGVVQNQLIREQIEAQIKIAKRLGTDPPAEKVPPPTRLVVSDTTVEALAVRMQDNPRGLVLIRDELSAWLGGLDQYKSGGKGNDRQFYLQAWSCTPVPVDRKSQADGIPLLIPRPCLSIVGGIQPEVLAEIAGPSTSDDGLIDRFLFVKPDPVKVRFNDDSLGEGYLDEWTHTVAWLWDRRLVHDEMEGPQPWVTTFTPEARAEFGAWFDRHCEEAESINFPRRLVGPWAKMRAYCARLALVLQMLDDASARRTPSNDPAPPVGLKATRGAIKLIEGYFKPHRRRANYLFRGSSEPDNPDASAVLAWIRRMGHAEFTLRQVKHDLRGRFGEAQADLMTALTWLTQRGWIRANKAQEPGKRGPKSLSWSVHPGLAGLGEDEPSRGKFGQFDQFDPSVGGGDGL